MTMCSDHKHKSSLQTVTPVRVITAHQLFADVLQKVISTHGSTSLLPDMSLTASRAGEQPLVKCPRGQAKQYLPHGCGNLLLDSDKQQDIVFYTCSSYVGKETADCSPAES